VQEEEKPFENKAMVVSDKLGHTVPWRYRGSVVHTCNTGMFDYGLRLAVTSGWASVAFRA